MREHKHDENCGCSEDFDEVRTVTLTLDDDSELECAIVNIFTVKDNDYIALLPLYENEDDDEGEVFLYRYIAGETEDEAQLLNIEDDEEFEAVSEAFDEFLDSQEFDEVFGDEDEE